MNNKTLIGSIVGLAIAGAVVYFLVWAGAKGAKAAKG